MAFDEFFGLYLDALFQTLTGNYVVWLVSAAAALYSRRFSTGLLVGLVYWLLFCILLFFPLSRGAPEAWVLLAFSHFAVAIWILFSAIWFSKKVFLKSRR